jgi:Ca2+-binding EF-hand superfamily protein
MELILLRIKRRIASKGANGYAIFEKALRAIDTDSDMLVSMHEFKKVIKDQRIDITETEASMVFEVFDQ